MSEVKMVYLERKSRRNYMDLGTLGYDAFMFYFEKKGLDKLRKKVLSDVNGDVLD